MYAKSYTILLRIGHLNKSTRKKLRIIKKRIIIEKKSEIEKKKKKKPV